jgi:hypothetical protein
MARYALPLRIQVNPGVGEAAIVLEGLARIRTFGVIAADDNGHVLIRKDFHPLVGDQCGAICGILQVRQELGLVHYRPVVVVYTNVSLTKLSRALESWCSCACFQAFSKASSLLSWIEEFDGLDGAERESIDNRTQPAKVIFIALCLENR